MDGIAWHIKGQRFKKKPRNLKDFIYYVKVVSIYKALILFFTFIQFITLHGDNKSARALNKTNKSKYVRRVRS